MDIQEANKMLDEADKMQMFMEKNDSGSRKIEHPEDYELCTFDGVTAATVYIGGFANLKLANGSLKWRIDKAMGEQCYNPYNVLTLKEIQTQLSNQYGGHCPMITIFMESPLSGAILQYGNYGDDWWQVGSLMGYA